MSNRPPRIPMYRLHKPTGQAVVRLSAEELVARMPAMVSAATA